MGYSSIVVRDSVMKTVACRNCGQVYRYEMRRTEVGNHRSKETTNTEAEALANKDAETKLQVRLKNECDMVSCPKCGAITDEMKAHRKQLFSGALYCLGGGTGLMLAVYAAVVFLGKFYIFGAVVGAVSFLVGLILLIIAMTQLVSRKGEI